MHDIFQICYVDAATNAKHYCFLVLGAPWVMSSFIKISLKFFLPQAYNTNFLFISPNFVSLFIKNIYSHITILLYYI